MEEWVTITDAVRRPFPRVRSSSHPPKRLEHAPRAPPRPPPRSLRAPLRSPRAPPRSPRAPPRSPRAPPYSPPRAVDLDLQHLLRSRPVEWRVPGVLGGVPIPALSVVPEQVCSGVDRPDGLWYVPPASGVYACAETETSTHTLRCSTFDV